MFEFIHDSRLLTIDKYSRAEHICQAFCLIVGDDK